MNKITKICILITFSLLFISLSLCIMILFNSSDDLTAKIYQNGELLYSINLDEIDEPYEIVIIGEQGESNTISLRPGEIGITHANCPDKLCVNAGYIHNKLLPITCLPNHIIIQIEQNTNVNASGDEVDGLAY